ncbi:DUF4221 family protein [Algoriphagus namhaensis]
MKSTFLTCLSLILLLISCQKNEKKIVEIDFEELVSDTLFLEKSPLTKELGYNFDYFLDEREGPTLRVFVENKLYEYSYPEGKILRTQEYETEGPDGIGTFVQAHLLDEDVIWFISNLELIKTDLYGKVLERQKLPEAEESRQSANYSTRMGANMYRDGASLLIPDVPFVLNEGLMSYENWILTYDTQRATHSYLTFKWPAEYQGLLNDANFSRYRTSYSPEQKEMLISLPASDSLLIVGQGKNSKVYAGVNDPMTYLKGEVTQDGEWVVFNSNNNTSQYGGIFWAEQEQVYVRLAEVVRDTKQNREEGIIPLTKLVVLNSSLEKIAEVKLPFATGGFNTPNGFYLWIGYPQSEDEVAYVKLDFARLKTD